MRAPSNLVAAERMAVVNGGAHVAMPTNRRTTRTRNIGLPFGGVCCVPMASRLNDYPDREFESQLVVSRSHLQTQPTTITAAMPSVSDAVDAKP